MTSLLTSRVKKRITTEIDCLIDTEYRKCAYNSNIGETDENT